MFLSSKYEICNQHQRRLIDGCLIKIALQIERMPDLNKLAMLIRIASQ